MNHFHSQKLDSVDIVDFISDYVQLKKSGQNYKALCPFHSEKTPSFVVSQSKQIFHCFGCGIGGGKIDFIMKYKNLSFRQALKYLGIGGSYRPNPREIKKRELLQHFRQWCDGYYDDISSLLRCLWKGKEQVKDEADLEKLVPFYHKESTWLHRIEILQSNDDKAKFELYKEVVYGN